MTEQVQEDSVNDVNETHAACVGVAFGMGGNGASQVVIKRNPPSQLNSPSRLSILQLNVEGLRRAKCEVIQQLCFKHSISILVLQETHTKSDKDINIYRFATVCAIHTPFHGVATLVRTDLSAALVAQSPPDAATMGSRSNQQRSAVNICKPPRAPFETLPV